MVHVKNMGLFLIQQIHDIAVARRVRKRAEHTPTKTVDSTECKSDRAQCLKQLNMEDCKQSCINMAIISSCMSDPVHLDD